MQIKSVQSSAPGEARIELRNPKVQEIECASVRFFFMSSITSDTWHQSLSVSLPLRLTARFHRERDDNAQRDAF